MTRVHVAMILRNELSRHLQKAAECATEVAALNGGSLIVTDDCSDDGSYEFMREFTSRIRQFDHPMFMKHEGIARQAHYEWVSMHVHSGDWVLSLDADETVNDPRLVREQVEEAERRQAYVVLMPLYEFWSEDPPLYRTDGFWHGTLASRLYRFENGGRIQDKEFACGSEPTYVGERVRSGRALKQNDLHLLHWGYVFTRDRLAKYERYSQREGGHGHNDQHIRSIVDPNPSLAEYPVDARASRGG